MKRRSLSTTWAMFWPSMATRNISASSDPSSQGTMAAIHLLTPPFPLTVGESPVPGPGLAHTPGHDPIPGRMGLAPGEAPAGPLA